MGILVLQIRGLDTELPCSQCCKWWGARWRRQRGKKWLTHIPSVTGQPFTLCFGLGALLSAALCPEEQRMAGPISLLATTSTKISQRFVVVTEVGSIVVCSSYNIFCYLLKLIATGARVSLSRSLSISLSLGGEKKKQLGQFQLKYWFLFTFSLPTPPFWRVLAKQPGLAPKHNYENGPLGCFF